MLCSDKTGPSPAKVSALLAHELVHAYDRCTADVDFGAAAHLACTEVRAAALAHCMTVPCLASRRECVRARAAGSVAAIRGVGREEAAKEVDAVFERCYGDREPFGRFAYDAGSARAAEEEYEVFVRRTRKK